MANLTHEIARKWCPMFMLRTKDVPPQHGGILPSEMLLFISACLECGVQTVIESGRKFGHSTEILACFADQWEVVSIERHPDAATDKRLKNRPNLSLLKGDGAKHMARLLKSYPRAALLLDGPKNMAGIELYLIHKREIVLAGVHDLCKRIEGGDANGGREWAEFEIEGSYFSDDPEYVAEFGHLDEAALKQAQHTHASLLPVASVLGILPGGLAKGE